MIGAAIVALLLQPQCPLGEDSLVRLLSSRRSADDSKRGQADRALGGMGGARETCLLLGLESRDPEVRADAADAFGAYGASSEALEKVAAALGDENASVRVSAARSLGELGVLKVVPAVLPHLKDPDPRVRAAAATALGELALPSPAVLAGLERALGDSDAQVRSATLGALADLGRGARPVLGTLLSMLEEGRNRGEVLAVLGAIGPQASDSLPAVETVIQEGDAVERVLAIRTRWQITGNADRAVSALQAFLDEGQGRGDAAALAVAAATARDIGPRARSVKGQICALASEAGVAEGGLSSPCEGRP